MTKRLKRLPEADGFDRLEATVRAAAGVGVGALLGLPPVLAASLAAWLGAFFSTPLQRRRDSWLVSLSDVVSEINRRLGKVESLANNEAFIDLVLTATPIAMRTASEIKRRALRNAVLNAGLGKQSPTKQHLFVRLIDEFSEDHMIMLSFLRSWEAWAEQNRVQFGEGEFVDVILKPGLPQIAGDQELMKVLSNDLLRRDLIEMDNHAALAGDPSNAGVDPWTLRVTMFGSAFLDFVGDAGFTDAR